MTINRAIDDSLATPTYNPASTKSARIVENPDGKLDGDDFLKLFLESLKHQDPTSPVETKDMMAQTAQLTTVETNVANKKALESITETLKSSSQYQSQFGVLPAIGKLASLKEAVVDFDGSNPKDFEIYFEDSPKSGSIIVTDSKGQKVREMSLLNYTNGSNQVGEDENGKKIEDSKGVLNFTWDGREDNGLKLPKGKYEIEAEYIGSDSKKHTIKIGTNIVESVKFENSEPYLKMGGDYVKFSNIGEIR